jgi:hypothetical protein
MAEDACTTAEDTCTTADEAAEGAADTAPVAIEALGMILKLGLWKRTLLLYKLGKHICVPQIPHLVK